MSKPVQSGIDPSPAVGSAATPTTWQRYRITGTLQSDAHLGSGSGGAGVDALVARDRRGRPVIWASHLEGVLLDAARRLFDDERRVRALFGSAGDQRQQAIFTSLYSISEVQCRVWRSTARASFANRAPKEDTLRAIEFVPKGSVFVGQVELPAEQVEDIERLLLEVDALGGGRAPGSGRIKLEMAEDERALGSVPLDVSAIYGASTAPDPDARLRLVLKARDPICISATATPGNLIPSLAYVPGPALQGALVRWLLAEGQTAAAELLITGTIAPADALPLPEGVDVSDSTGIAQWELSPAPLALQSPKPAGSAAGLPWWAQPGAARERVDAFQPPPVGEKPEKLKRPEDDLFVFREDSRKPWKAYRPLRRVRLRNGRPLAGQEEPDLYAIEQIAEGTLFLAELAGEAGALQQLTNALQAVLEGRRWLRIGRGGAPVEVIMALGYAEPKESASKTDQPVYLTLTSDLLCRDEWLRWRTEVDIGELRQLLGVETIDLVRDDRGKALQLQESVMVYGYNGTARLRRLPAAGIRRGSVFRIQGPGITTLYQRHLKGQWLGERTHVGYGRFRLDLDLPGITQPGELTPPTGTADTEEEAVAQHTKGWFDTHGAALVTSTRSRDGEARAPSPSQWSDLLAALERRDSGALSQRLNPTTAGGRTWTHPDARAVLLKLQGLRHSQALYARYFVRWLRAPIGARQQQTEVS